MIGAEPSKADLDHQNFSYSTSEVAVYTENLPYTLCLKKPDPYDMFK